LPFGIFTIVSVLQLEVSQQTIANCDKLCYILHVFGTPERIYIMLTKQKKINAIKKTRRHESDTGSPQAQVAILSKRIDELATHLKKNHKDNHSRRGLLQMVANRRKHLKYLENKDSKAYAILIKTLGLKK